MHFANKETIHGKAVRACSFVLAMLIMCSMMFVGQVGSVKVDAFAKSDFIYAGKMMFIDVSEVSNWWFTDGGKLELQCWSEDGGYAVYTIATGAGSSNSDYWVAENTYCFVFPKEHDAFLVRRPTNSEGDYTNQTVNVTEQPLGCNCLVIKDANSNQSYQHGTRWKKQIDWKYFDDTGITRSIRTGTSDSRFLTAKQNFGAQVDGVTLFPISAQFYDYYTDYEIEYGWRSQKDNSADGAVSRSWMNSFPFNNLNKYISNMANGKSGWQYPLYFGNFFTYEGYYYSASAQHPRFDGENPSRDGGLVNRFNESSPIVKFSSQANNSMFLKDQGATAYKSDSTLQYSFASLVNSTLSNDNITMGTGAVTVPYFSDDLVTNGYATKVTSKFPMRVTDATTTDSQPYKKYSFNSKDGTDNIYFSNYGTDNFSINYSATKKVRDALSGFDNTGNGIGFFPFDNDNGTYSETDAYDFGFGVRWDMQFNLTKDGKISNSVDPITFSFSGDDDVWVFIDGQLALDLGGDHKWATGKIDFAAKTSTVTTGVYKPNGNYNNPINYYKSSSTDLNYTVQSGNTYVAQLNSGIFAESDFYSKPHTMTVFYMERGMSESNLSMEFTMSPLENQLLVDKTVDYNDVNDDLKTVTKKYVDSDTFNYEVKVGDSSTTTNLNWTYSYGGATSGVPVYTDLNGENSTQLANGTVTGIKNGEGFIFNKQINDNGSKYVDVKEIDTENLYTYSHHMSVKDVSNNSTDTDTDTDEVNFNFKTKSRQQGAVTNFEVHNINTVQTGKVTLNKVYNGTANTTGKFNFDVKIKVPGAQESEIKTISCEVTAGTPAEITGIPIGSQVVVTETGVTSTEYTTSYVIGTGSNTNGTTATITKLENDTTVTFTNEDVVPNVSATVEANKKLDGSSSEIQFNFTLTKLDSGVKSTTPADIQTAQNGTDGKISFNLSDLEANQTFNYLLEEQSESNSIYNFDTNKYWVEVNTSTNPATVKYSKTTVNGDTYSKGDEVSGGVTFSNTTKTASIIVKKTDSNNETKDFTGTKFKIYEVTEEGAELPANAKEEKEITTSENTVTFDGLEHGKWYAIVETKAVDGYELNGTVFYRQADATKDVSVTAEAEEITVTVQDNKSTNLPQTGGPGAVMLVLGGIVLVSVGVYLLKPSKKDKTNSK